MAKTKILICPYCGEMQPVGERCPACGGLFEPLSRQATHNAMGPWFVRNPMRPFQPGCSYETMVKMVERGQIIKTTIVRGPTSKQFWTAARRLPGVAHLLGCCHNCDASVDPGDHGCHSCGVPFGAYLDRNYLGLPEVKPLPWEAPIVEGMGAADSRNIDWQRAAEPMGISSFASDRELRGSGYSATGPGSFGSGGGGSLAAAGVGTSTFSASASGGNLIAAAPPGSSFDRSHLSGQGNMPAATAVESATSGVLAKTLQRRVDEQQRTIRTLIIIMAVLTVLSLLIVAMKFMSTSTPGTSNPKDKSAAKPAVVSPIAATTPASAPASMPAVDFADDLRHANQLMEAAAKTERTIPERIADYEEAQKLFKGIAAKVPKSQQPKDLDERLKKIDQELGALKMKQFFP